MLGRAIRQVTPPRTLCDLRSWSARAHSFAKFSLILLHADLGMNSSVRADDLWEQRTVDASSVTCGDFGRLTLPRALIAVGWIAGFYAGLKNDTRVDVALLVDRAERVISVCRDNESMRLMDVVERELGRGQ